MNVQDTQTIPMAGDCGPGWGQAKWLMAVVAMAAVLAPRGLSGQTSAPVRHRYLLIVETSHAMERRTDGLNKEIRELVASGCRGEMRQGDTLGVWTFNDSLYAGQFPLQRFSPDDPFATTSEVLKFLKNQKYEKGARWESVLPGLKHLVQSPAVLTVILLTAETETVQGTPFDAQINQAFKSWRDQQQSARMPLVTVLRAHDGKITNFAVSAAPWPVEFPSLPIEPQVAKPASAAPSVVPVKPAPAKAPPPMGAPLIVSGRKPPTDAVESKPAAVPNAASAVPASGADSANVRPSAAGPASPPMASPPIATGPVTGPTSHPASPAQIAAPLTEKAPEPTPKTTSQATGAGVTGETPRVAEAPASGPVSSSAAETVSQNAGGATNAGAAPSGSEASGQLATAAAGAPAGHHGLAWLGAAIGLGAAVVSVILVRKRSKPKMHVSLITRSLERQAPEPGGKATKDG